MAFVVNERASIDREIRSVEHAFDLLVCQGKGGSFNWGLIACLAANVVAWVLGFAALS